MPYEIIRFPYDFAIDADGHVLEPAWLWEEALEAAHRPRALRIRVDTAGLVLGEGVLRLYGLSA